MKLNIFILALLVCTQVYADPNNGLVAQYLLNGNLQDSTGNHADITNVGLTLTADKDGNPDSAYKFSATGHTLQVPVTVVNGLVDWTVSFWIKADSTSSNSVYYSWANTSVQRYLYQFFFSKYFGIGGAAQSNGYHQWSLTNNISNGNWQFITISRNTAAFRVSIYVDGVLHQEIDTTGRDTTDPIQIDSFVFGNLQDSQIYGGYSSGWQFHGSIQDIRFYGRYFSAADAGEVQADAGNGNGGNGGGEPTDDQTCIDYLAVLEPSVVTEDLTFPLNTDENEYYHYYDIKFNAFTFDTSCFVSQVWLGGNLLDHEVVDNGIIITFPWKDAGAWGCTEVSPTEQQCQFQVHVYWNNVLQHKKLFTSTVTTPDLEDLSQELNLNVINDEDESLKNFDQSIDTQLKFCADAGCSSYTTPSEIIRNTDVYVEFKVNTPGYNQYFPVHQRFTLNDFNVDIQNQAAIDSWAEQGRIIYHFRPPFAADNILLAVGISLSQTNPNRRRMLSEVDTSIGYEEQKDNVGKYMRISVLEEGSNKTSDEKKEKEDSDNTGLYIGIIAGAVVLTVSLVGLVVYYKLKTQKSSGANYQAKSNNSGDNIQSLNSEQRQLDIEVK